METPQKRTVIFLFLNVASGVGIKNPLSLPFYPQGAIFEGVLGKFGVSSLLLGLFVF